MCLNPICESGQGDIIYRFVEMFIATFLYRFSFHGFDMTEAIKFNGLFDYCLWTLTMILIYSTVTQHESHIFASSWVNNPIYYT